MRESNVETAEFVQSVVQQVCKIVSELAGIQLGPRQYSMVENRLKSRMLRLGINGFQNYLIFLKANLENESQALLSLMTTHHTYFFREFSHFEFLLNRGLPRIIEKARSRQDKTIHVWSAACSRGQEVYSLAMFFRFHLSQMAPDVKFKIWGTDIDPESVKHAENGVFKAEELKQSPAMYIEGNWVRGTGNVRDFSKVKDIIKQHCKFRPLNLFESESFLKDKVFDVIFCRNVFIYFNREQIEKLSHIFFDHLDKEGLLFLGVSESLSGLSTAADLTGPSVYQHKRKPNEMSAKPIPRQAPEPVRNVLAIDDSPTILALLKRILTKESGFVVTATAKNGREALEILKSKKFDFITLDLHMPELDGIGFLKEYSDRKTPILVVSSINRDDTTIASKALELGASDYVEKPSLDNMIQAGNEIRAKMKSILQLKSPSVPQGLVSNLSTSSNGTNLEARALKPFKVLIVDDSATIRQLLVQILSKDPMFEVVAAAEKPSEVEALIKKHKPDVITLDINMPEMDGVTLLQRLHPIYKIPTVMISSISKEEGPLVLRALEIGAVDYIQKPEMKQLAEASQNICERLKVAARAKVKSHQKAKRSVVSRTALDSSTLIVIGASTGGTEALREVLEVLPAQIPPILIVQHIPPVFSAAFANRLNELCKFKVKEAKDGEEIVPNQVLIAPGGTQMSIRATKDKLFVRITDEPPMNRHKPSVDFLFKSVAEAKLSHVVGAIFTGMGADGAKQLLALKNLGARTIAQNEATCVVYGMPKEAVALGAAEFILPLDEIANKLLELSQKQDSAINKKAS